MCTKPTFSDGKRTASLLIALALLVGIKEPINQLQCMLAGGFTLLLYLPPPSSTAVRVTLTNDLNKIFKSLQTLEPKGKVNFVTGIRIAHVSSYFGGSAQYISTCITSFVIIPRHFSLYERTT